MRKSWIIGWILFLGIPGGASLSGQTLSDREYEDDYYDYYETVVEHDTVYIRDTIYISALDDVTRIFNRSFDDFSKLLLDSVQKQDTAQVHSLERLYLNYLLPMYYPSFMEHRYIVRTHSVEISGDYLKMDIRNMKLPSPSLRDSLALDVMLICRGDVNTDNFLKSRYYRASCLKQLFLSIQAVRQRNIQGINFYFPDFSFKEKRAMAQLIKSASLVIDSCHIQSFRDLKLYVTFDKENGMEHYNYIAGLTQMVDDVLLVDSKLTGWPRDSVRIINKANLEKTPWLSKVLNQFYLARFHLDDFPVLDKTEELSPHNLRLLIEADYPYNQWEYYFFALAAILVAMLTVLLLYRYVPRFSYFLNTNLTYFFSVIIMLILEAYLLFVCMVENMSHEDVFTFAGENESVFLLFPLLFLFIIPMLNMISKRKEKP